MISVVNDLSSAWNETITIEEISRYQHVSVIGSQSRFNGSKMTITIPLNNYWRDPEIRHFIRWTSVVGSWLDTRPGKQLIFRSGPELNGQHFVLIFSHAFSSVKTFEFGLKFPQSPNNNKPALLQRWFLHRIRDRPFAGPTLINVMTCVQHLGRHMATNFSVLSFDSNFNEFCFQGCNWQ